jgi:hypothetical protein
MKKYLSCLPTCRESLRRRKSARVGVLSIVKNSESGFSRFVDLQDKKYVYL